MVERRNLTQVTYRRKGAQHFHPVLRRQRMGGVHAAEVGQTGGGVGRRPAQDVAQLRRVCVNGVPRHQELRKEPQEHIRIQSHVGWAGLGRTARPYLHRLGDIADRSGIQPDQSGNFSNNGVVLKPGHQNTE